MSEIHSELGQSSDYDLTYNPTRLFPIARADKRREIGIDPLKLPFRGFDCWNHYEVSWLNEKGKPIVATAEIIYGCESPMIVESKSMKLYFNSFNNASFKSREAVEQTIKQDLEHYIQADVFVKILPLNASRNESIKTQFEGENLDEQDISHFVYQVEPSFLETHNEFVRETLCSDLLKSNCLVTNQPDWGSIQISYEGPKINREGLLRYIVSFRNHNEFHEQCIERIFIDILNRCKPQALTVYGRYTRRGGLDINPYRTTQMITQDNNNHRLLRQ